MLKIEQYSNLMIFNAIEDYLGARCCILNKLSVGFELAAQAIEKILKAAIILESQQKTQLKGNDLHNPFKLKEELKLYKNYELDIYDDQFKKLFGHFQCRYHDNKDQSNRMCSDELKLIDEIFISIFLKLPIKDEIKSKLGRLVPSLTEDNRFWIEHKICLIKENKSINLLDFLIKK